MKKTKINDETEKEPAIAGKKAPGKPAGRGAGTAEMQRLMAEAVAKAKGDFLANVGHEIRSPLNAVIGFCEVLQDEHFGKLNEKQKVYVGNIHESGVHLLGMIDNILEFVSNRREDDEITLEKVFVRKDVLDFARLFFKEKTAKHGITFSVETAFSDDIAVKADRRDIRQALYSLVSNAVKFTPDGGSVKITAAAVQGKAVITVEDTGIGIRPEDINKLFREFTQLEHPSTTKSYQGLGMGLALAKKLLEQYGGEIKAESELGRGSRFTFSLPLAGS